MSRNRNCLLLILLFLIGLRTIAAETGTYKYFRVGSHVDINTKPTSGIALMGGGSDLDEAFRWLCDKGSGGDFLVLRVTGDDDYNSYVNGLCETNSVATLIIPDRQTAQNHDVAEIIRKAEVLFIAGGDQANYIRAWHGTPIQNAINAHVAAGKPIGGTSAGLAVLGEFVYGALKDKPDDTNLASNEVLLNPYFERVTLVRDFLNISHLENLITESHFARRNRMGRTLGFLARIMQDGWSQYPRGIAIDEKSAVLVEADGKGKVVGSGRGAYFLRPSEPPATCKQGLPLILKDISVYRVPNGGNFDLTSWRGEDGVPYSLSVDAGRIQSSQPSGSIY